MDLEEGLLEEVLRGGPITYQAGQKPQQVVVKAFNELSVGLRVSVAECDKDLLVGLGGEIRQMLPLAPVAGFYDDRRGKDRLFWSRLRVAGPGMAGLSCLRHDRRLGYPNTGYRVQSHPSRSVEPVG